MSRSVIPIPPSYSRNGEFNPSLTEKYVEYLFENGATVLMTTAGTSQFGLLSKSEINTLNAVVSRFNGQKILGIPSYNTKLAKEFIKDGFYFDDPNVNAMGIYPDRFYDKESIYTYFSELRESTNKPLYLHAMFMRKGIGGNWDYESDIISSLYEKGIICGIKEEYSDLQKSFNFIDGLPNGLDIIVAGGSMRRHVFLKNAGANSFLAGVGNFFPSIESDYFHDDKPSSEIKIETKLFKVFNKYGWHRSLRSGLNNFLKFSDGNRNPWPEEDSEMIREINDVLTEIRNEINEQR